MNTEFRLIKTPFSFNDIEVYARRGDAIMKEVVFEDVGKGLYSPPAFGLSAGEAQQLMDELWQCGLRPTEGTGSAGALAATQSHLEDLRKITFNQLKIK